MPLYETNCKLPVEVQAEVDRKAEERVRLMKAYSRSEAARRRWVLLASVKSPVKSGVFAGK